MTQATEESEEANSAFSGVIHASSVVVQGRAILLSGPSGVGKSDLALRLIDRGATLLCDDYTHIVRHADSPIAKAMPTIAGLIEVRGIGLIRQPHIDQAPVALIVSLLEQDEPQPQRLPDSLPVRTLCGVDVPVLTLHGFEASAPLKIELALKRITGQSDIMEPMR